MQREARAAGDSKHFTMLIGLSGVKDSGKEDVVKYLIQKGFKLLEVRSSAIDDKISSIQLDDNSQEPFQKFDDFDTFYDYVTANWRDKYVITDINSNEELTHLHKRPFFLHVSVDSTLERKLHRLTQSSGEEHCDDKTQLQSLRGFISRSDQQFFNRRNPMIEINNQAHFKIFISTTSQDELYAKLDECQLWDTTRLRPTWDSYFMKLADLAALRSNCMKRRVGCVIVKENRVVATGYNGTPRHITNCNEGGCHRCNAGNPQGSALSTCLCLHAEENALLESGRDRIGSNSILYCNTCPCLTCSVKIVQTGVKEVVFAQSYSMDTASRKVLEEGKVVLRQYRAPIQEIFI